MSILDHFRIVKDFKPGVNFYDISTLLLNPKAFNEVIEGLAERLKSYEPDLVMGIEARGFLLAPGIAQTLGVPTAMVRKEGKLPGQAISKRYDLEYGSDTMQIQPDLVGQFKRVVIVDDLMATGGTMAAAEALVQNCGAFVVATACIIELDGLNGREKIEAPFEALVKAPG